MSLTINSKKIIASVMALSIVASGVFSSEASIFSKIVPTNTISASAAVSYGDWEYEETGTYTAKLTKYKGNGGYVIIPESINGHTVKELGFGLFKSNKKVKSVSIPRGVLVIPDQCFDGATSLETVNIPEGLKTIGSSAFCGATNLKTISIPQSVTTIDYNAFAYSGITSISLPSVNTFGNYVFSNCKNLKSVILSNSITKLTYSMFKSCSSLESIVIPNSVSSIDAFVFEGCTSLKSVTISRYPEKLFREGVFRNCTSLENLNISDPAILNQLFIRQSLNDCKKFNKLNNQTIVSYRSKRYSPNAEPVFQTAFDEVIRKNFRYCDVQKFAFYNEYLNAIVKYTVGTNTHSGMTKGQKIKALHDWVCDKVDYAYVNGKPDPSTECHVDSSVFMRDTTVCDGYARALTLLLREAGIETYYLSSSNHAWCMVKLGNRYFHVDSCHDGQSSTTNYSHFLKSDNDIKKCSSGHSSWKIDKPGNSRINYTLSPMPACQYSIGDVNMDGKITQADVSTIQNYLLKKITLSDTAKLLADVNLDGQIDMSDAVSISY
ncbi:MAG: leucine-rich repeat protein [Ruminococcus sp.]|nr:leucine-rich repeat protein [Ruminococcus sp.]